MKKNIYIIFSKGGMPRIASDQIYQRAMKHQHIEIMVPIKCCQPPKQFSSNPDNINEIFSFFAATLKIT